jgi:demethylmenaquinone methyltransferase/2-methoxy-6-polyprenyl-1,4-benzoquinol methylase
MSIQAIERSWAGRPFTALAATVMESGLRYRFFSPTRILDGIGDLSGRTVLEVGCGTGYFTIPAARRIGGQGSLVAMDILSQSVAMVSKKTEDAHLANVRVVRADALQTGLDDESFDVAFLFGVVPSPMLPLPRLVAEMHRLLRPRGVLALWPAIPGWLRRSVVGGGLFSFANRRNGVLTFRRAQVGE